MPPAATVRRRAVVLVGGPVAPYSRAIRIARALAAEGYAVEIAAIAAPGLPAVESVAPARPGAAGDPEPEPAAVGSIEIRRYRPRGPWAIIGASEAATIAQGGARSGAGGGRIRAVARRLAGPLLDLRRWLFWPHVVRGWWATLAADLPPADVYHACGALAIAPALAARRRHPVGPSGSRARVIHDAIDHAAAGNEVGRMPAPVRGVIARREAAWARSADAIVTVNGALAATLARTWHRRAPIVVVPNAPEPPNPAVIAAPPDLLRRAAGLPATTRLVLHQGRIGRGLGLDEATKAILLVPDAALVLLGFGRGFAASLARDADARLRGRHVTLPPRPPDELLAWTAGADAALVALPPISANQRQATPNKFWEALAVGVPVVSVRGLDAMTELIVAHDLGAVAESLAPVDLAAAIAAVLDRAARDDGSWRRRIAETFRERFGWPAAATEYRALVRATTAADPSGRADAPT